ncbi:unnamed protein product, partial [Iphiclides podalirius]
MTWREIPFRRKRLLGLLIVTSDRCRRGHRVIDSIRHHLDGRTAPLEMFPWKYSLGSIRQYGGEIKLKPHPIDLSVLCKLGRFVVRLHAGGGLRGEPMVINDGDLAPTSVAAGVRLDCHMPRRASS